MMWERTTIEHDGAKLQLVDSGTASESDPVVFLHAGVADLRMWEGQLQDLAAKHRVIAYDRRGFGRTDSPNEPFSHVGDLAGILNARGVDRAVLVGCSQGGRIVIDFALAEPARVAGLVLVSTAISGAEWPQDFEPEVAAVVAGYEAADESGNQNTLNRFEARVWLDGPRAEAGRMQGPTRMLVLEMNLTAIERESAEPLDHEIEPPSALDRLGELSAPTLVVAGDLDFPHIIQRSADLSKAAGARFELLEGVAHLLPLEAPHRFNPVLTSFLDSIAAPTEETVSK